MKKWLTIYREKMATVPRIPRIPHLRDPSSVLLGIHGTLPFAHGFWVMGHGLWVMDPRLCTMGIQVDTMYLQDAMHLVHGSWVKTMGHG